MLPVEETTPEEIIPEAPVEETTPLEHVDPTAPKPEAIEPTSEFSPEKASDSVVFHVNDISTPTREFSEENHGPSWKEVAMSFFKNNSHKITSVDHL